MRKLEGRAVLCLILAAILVLGVAFFTVRLGLHGGEWASFYANQHVFSEGVLAVGSVYDRNGILLLKNDKEGPHYNEDAEIRRANLHVTGDKGVNISTGANAAFRSKIIGYNFVTGTKGLLFGSGRQITLTVDAEANRAAYNALKGRNGLVCVYNWKTGEILTLVSSPSVDPENESETENAPSGTYINKAISATFTPGSVFKLVTTAAAIENIEDLNSWTFECTGSYEIEGDKVTCSQRHGKVDIYSALAKSCNCAYAELILNLGSGVMEEYTDKLGLTDSYDINGIQSAKGSFIFDAAAYNMAWAGIGQYEDQLNPLSMTVYMGAIAGGGETKTPVLLEGSHASSISLLSSSTAAVLAEMMRNNVTENYGEDRFPGLDVHGKTGTAEVGEGRAPHSWFCGFSGDYAFTVCVENGGSGIGAAASVANETLQYLKNSEES